MRSCGNTLIYGSEPLKSCVFPYGTRWNTYWHIHAVHIHSLYKQNGDCYPGKQLAHQILYMVLAKCGYFSCSLLVTKDTWVPPRSYPLPLFSNLPFWKQLSPRQKTAPKLFHLYLQTLQQTFIHVPELPYSCQWQ